MGSVRTVGEAKRHPVCMATEDAGNFAPEEADGPV
jgi:hypothetical protein